jgi:transposase
MATKFITIDRQTPLLLPPDLRDWVKKDHLVHFIIDAVEHIDVSSVAVNQRGSGSAQYPPSMLLALLVYSYATGVFSSRQIERTTYENVAVRLLCADTHPDHDTICTFRRENRELVQKAFAQLLEMSAACGVLKLGQITVAVDGTKILANASKHSAVSHDHAVKTLAALDLEIVELLRKADAADSAPLQDGLTIPAEIQRREERKAILAKAKAEIEARANLRFQAEQANYEAVVAKRAAFTQATGKKSSGRAPTPPDPTPGPKDQVNLTDEVSRIMKTGQGFQQCYNAQAGADTDSRLIVGPRVTNAPTDKQQLGPNMEAIAQHIAVKNVLIDSGFVSEAAVNKTEAKADGSGSGIVVYAAIKREPHGRTIAQLEAHEDPPEPGPEASFSERMLHRTATAAGRALYKLRQQTIEPIFGIIKEALGFRRFLLRGLDKVSLEWELVCLAYNFKRLHRLKAQLRPA